MRLFSVFNIGFGLASVFSLSVLGLSGAHASVPEVGTFIPKECAPAAAATTMPAEGPHEPSVTQVCVGHKQAAVTSEKPLAVWLQFKDGTQKLFDVIDSATPLILHLDGTRRTKLFMQSDTNEAAVMDIVRKNNAIVHATGLLPNARFEASDFKGVITVQ